MEITVTTSSPNVNTVKQYDSMIDVYRNDLRAYCVIIRAADVEHKNADIHIMDHDTSTLKAISIRQSKLH